MKNAIILFTAVPVTVKTFIMLREISNAVLLNIYQKKNVTQVPNQYIRMISEGH